MVLPCDICGRTTHQWYDCPDRAKNPAGWKPDRLTKSTAAGKDRLSRGEVEPSRPKEARRRSGGQRAVDAKDAGDAQRQSAETSEVGNGASRTSHREPPAGTQAPPVDAPSRLPKKQRAPKKTVKDLTAAGVVTRGPGRPRIHSDRKAYKAQKERERRAKKKAGVPFTVGDPDGRED